MLVYVYASTHGVMYNWSSKTQIVFNEDDIARRYYDLQSRLDFLAKEYSNVYIIAVFDCSRKRKNPPTTRKDLAKEEQAMSG